MSKPETIEWTVRRGFTDERVPVHNARRVEFAGFEGFEFASHNPQGRKSLYVVSEKESGFTLSRTCRTRKEAEASAGRTLAAYSNPKDLRRRIKLACKGKNPRVPGQAPL